MMDINRVVSSLEKNYVIKLLKQGSRIDGRGLFDFREVTIIPSFVPKAEGSADVHLGDTRIMAGIKYDIGTPFSDNPDEGVCTVSSEFLPHASPLFESGPPGEESIQLARVVDRGIRHSDCLDYKRLCIVPGKHVYILFLDAYIMDHGGNLVDATAIAAIVALLSTKLPTAKVVDGAPVWDGNYNPLTVKTIPLSISFGKIDNIIFIDPNMSEELVLDGSISFAVDEKGNINSVQKFGEALWSIEEIINCSKKAIETAKMLREKLNFRQYAAQ
jgi:exosome complex component RRP42